jgi:hypothetical protein
MDKYRFRMFEERVLRIRFGPRWEEVSGGCRILYNEEVHNFYSF